MQDSQSKVTTPRWRIGIGMAGQVARHYLGIFMWENDISVRGARQ